MKEIKPEDFIHNNDSKFLCGIREFVFGVEDGIVSTLGALIGIAVATQDQFIVIISGIVVIGVESISMGVGSYLSSKSVKEAEERKLHEEQIELNEQLEDEKEELAGLFHRDGWPLDLAKEMAEAASGNKELMLKEMSYRELFLIPGQCRDSISDAIVMFVSYIIGGSISLFAYFFLPIPQAIILSAIFAMFGLFLLGSIVSRFTRLKWWKAGIRMLLLGALSASVGYIIGQIVNNFK